MIALKEAYWHVEAEAFWKHNKEKRERLKHQLTETAESLESRKKKEVKVICAVKSEVIETLKDLVKIFVSKVVNNS